MFGIMLAYQFIAAVAVRAVGSLLCTHTILDPRVPRVIARAHQVQSTPCSSVSTQVLPLVPLTLLFYSFVTRRFERPVAWGALDTLSVDRADASVALMKAADKSERNLGLESQERISLKDGEENRPGAIEFELPYRQPERQPVLADEPIELGLQ